MRLAGKPWQCCLISNQFLTHFPKSQKHVLSAKMSVNIYNVSKFHKDCLPNFEAMRQFLSPLLFLTLSSSYCLSLGFLFDYGTNFDPKNNYLACIFIQPFYSLLPIINHYLLNNPIKINVFQTIRFLPLVLSLLKRVRLHCAPNTEVS